VFHQVHQQHTGFRFLHAVDTAGVGRQEQRLAA